MIKVKLAIFLIESSPVTVQFSNDAPRIDTVVILTRFYASRVASAMFDTWHFAHYNDNFLSDTRYSFIKFPLVSF